MPRALLLAGLLAVSLPAALAAHLRLVRSEPAAAEMLREAPAHVQLWFSEEPILPFSRLTLRGPSGAVPLGPVRAGRERSLLADVPSGLAPGAYRLAWRTAGDDGHAVDGTLDFTIAKPAPRQP
jgi:methionine-rich copper-binding protein CopC